MASNDVMDKVESDIESHGWHVLSVFGDGEPNFSYSIGFTETFNHPEVIMSGLSPKLMQALINDIGNLIRDGQTFSDKQLSDRVIKNFPVMFRAVTESTKEEYLRAATAIYGEECFDALQCVWPDKNGAFPEGSSKSQELFS